MNVPFWLSLTRFYSTHTPIQRGRLRIAKWLFKNLELPREPVSAAIAPDIEGDLYLWLWADFATYAVGGPEPLVLACYRSMLERSSVVLDIGAYIGLYAFAASGIVSEGSVHAFEPNPASAERIRRTIAANSLTNVQLSQCAMSDQKGTAQFAIDQTPVMSSLAGVESPAELSEVAVDTIDSYCSATGINQVDIVKIDVEGAELLVLRGGQDLLADRQPTLIVELHGKQSESFGYTVSDTVQFLLALGYDLFYLEQTWIGQPKVLPFTGEIGGRQIVIAQPARNG